MRLCRFSQSSSSDGRCPAPAPEFSKQGGGKRVLWGHGERETRDAEGVEFEVPRVETPRR